MAALMSLVPLWGIAAGVFKLAFPGGSDVRMVATSCVEDRVAMAIENIGGATGILGAVRSAVQRDGSVEALTTTLESDAGVIVAPGETVRAEFKFLSHGIPANLPLRGDSHECAVRFVFEVREFDGTQREATVKCPCL